MKSEIASAAGRNAEKTRAALIATAIEMFARQGFEATSTRELAGAANANIGSIAYHFGGKDGLREAAARHIAETIRGVAGTAFGLGGPDVPSADAAAAMLERGLETVLAFLLSQPQAGSFVQFVLRELSAPGPTLDILYDEVFEPMHKRVCLLWGAASGQQAESERTRLDVFTLIGQIVYFRIGRIAIARRMGWQKIGPDERGAIIQTIKRNMRAMLEAARKGERR